MAAFDQGGSDAAVAPRTRLESAIADIWQDVLGIDRLGIGDDFFELGGDSLGAVRMLAAVADALHAEVSFTDFLDGPTIGAMAAVLERAPERPARVETSTAGSPERSRGPCSSAQERLLFLEQLEGATGAYNMPIGVRLRGSLDGGALERSLREIVRRHAALRTTFGTEDGHAVQVTVPDVSLALERIDLSERADPEAEAHRIVDELASRPFDLERGPLMRAHLLRLTEDDHVLELGFHHVVCDGWSQVVVFDELSALYGSYSRGEEPGLPQPRVQYPEYARRQRSELDGPALEEKLARWVERLADAPAALDLPTDRPRPQLPSYRGATHRTRLPAETTAAVRKLARASKATPFTTFLAAYYVLLHRYSGQDQIVVGATTAARESSELEDGIGLFASTVALAGDLSGEPSFRELVVRARDVVMWAVAHQDAPFEQLVARLAPDRDLSRQPVFQVFCAHVPRAALSLPGSQPFDARPATSRFDLTLFVEEEDDDQVDLAWEYSTDLFDAATIERLERHYLRLLEEALADPDQAIDDLPLLDDSERVEVLGGAGADAPDYEVACMHERFERRAALTPDAIAVTFEDESAGYGELNERANRLAHHLRALGAQRDTLVALFLEPSLDLVVAILGVLKAGAAYVPLDPEYPSDRIAFVLDDTRSPLLVTQEHLLERLPAHEASVVCFGRDDAALAAASAANPEQLADPDSLAYVIYTSGSTGRPKGVQIEHRSVARLFSATDEWFGFGPSDTWVLLHSYAFDFSVWELWGALAYGGRLVISPLWTTRSPPALATLLAEQGVTVLNATPSLFSAIQEEVLRRTGESALRFVVFGGEALAPSTLRPWFDRHGDGGPVLVNMYGITETTVHVTYRPLRRADCERELSPIGVPIPDLRLYLLDPKGRPVPQGVAGELFVGGAGVARGYLNRPDLTAERFLANPFGPGRLYRTGDVARRLPDGELEFRGRIDDQVKVRGFRIELGEIQAAIADHADVVECAVIALEAAPGDTRLAAYVVPDGGASGPAATRLREGLWSHLEGRLPAFMVPASLTMLDRLPLTRNGKIDRRALPTPTWERQPPASFTAPRTPTELRIMDIWKEVLDIERVGVEDNFFHLGGHSLLAARVVTKTRKRCEVELSLRALFEEPTLAGFAAHVDSAPSTAAAAAPPAADAPPAAAPAVGGPSTTYPLSFPQQQLLFFDELTPGSATYNAALAIRVLGPLDVSALRDALADVFERHEALRTVLVQGGSAPTQELLDRWSVELPLVDLSGLPAAERDSELHRLLREHARRPFDLARELMLRMTLFRLGSGEHVILFQPHHIAFDAWAVEILYRDLGELYDARREHRGSRLPELPLQYRDFALWQRGRLAGEVLDGELDFWRTHLAGAPTVLALPTDHRRPTHQTFEGASHELELGRDLADALRDICRDQHVTPYMLLFAAFGTLLYRHSGQDDILLGGPMANREHAGFEHVIGFFANTVVVRARLGGNPTFAALLERVRESVLQSFEHQEVPFELVVEALRPERDPGLNPVFQVNFRVRVGPPPALELGGTETSRVPVDLGFARFDLALELHVLEDRITGELIYNTALFAPATIDRLAADFEGLLRQGLARPHTRLLSFDLSDQEQADAAAQPVPVPARSIRGFRGTGDPGPRDGG